MERRTFLGRSLLTGAALASGVGSLAAASAAKVNAFQLKYAPHLGMFAALAGEDPLDQLDFMSERGFRAFEDNGMKKRDLSLQTAMGKRLATHEMEMGVFVAHQINWKEPTLVLEDYRETFLKEIQESVEVAKRVNATWMTVVPGFVNLRVQPEYQTAILVETLKRASAILEPHGLVMVLEPLNFRNHPGLFLSRIPQAYQVCQAVGSPACKILFDVYHQQIQEGNLIPNMELAWEEIAYFQVGDNPGRKEPTTGEINYRNIFKFLHEREFQGVIGMEHGNSLPGAEGAEAVIEAYQEVDGF
ncbi:MAG: TIM barrel protein [Bacteroidota bacterium]